MYRIMKLLSCVASQLEFVPGNRTADTSSGITNFTSFSCVALLTFEGSRAGKGQARSKQRIWNWVHTFLCMWSHTHLDHTGKCVDIMIQKVATHEQLMTFTHTVCCVLKLTIMNRSRDSFGLYLHEPWRHHNEPSLQTWSWRNTTACVLSCTSSNSDCYGQCTKHQ